MARRSRTYHWLIAGSPAVHYVTVDGHLALHQTHIQ